MQQDDVTSARNKVELRARPGLKSLALGGRVKAMEVDASPKGVDSGYQG